MADGGAAAVSLPRDAVFEILTRAPVKSLCRFRYVSQEWQALISDRAFVAQHKSRTMLEPLLVTSYRGGKPYTDSSVLVMDTQGTVVREIKGLGTFASSLDNLCVISCSGKVTRVIDVATGTVLMASRKPAGHLRQHVVRLGRAAVSGSCKAVRIVDFCRAYGVQPPQTCEVLTIGAHWRWAQPPPAPVRLLDSGVDWAGTTVDGVVHFHSSCNLLAWDGVLCFDLESEKWGKLIDGPLKGGIDSWSQQIRLEELNKSLCMIQTGVQTSDHPSAHVLCNIWLLVDPGKSSWVKAYSIPTNWWPHEVIEPLRVMHDGVKLLFQYFSATLPHMLRVYDSRDESCTVAMKMPNNTFGRIGLCSLHLECFNI